MSVSYGLSSLTTLADSTPDPVATALNQFQDDLATDDTAVSHPIVIAARDTGSRAYGLENETSDYDVRALMLSPPHEYTSVSGVRTDASRTYTYDSDDVDIAAWDVRKFCRLLRDSDPSTCEWCYSDQIYLENQTIDEFVTDHVTASNQSVVDLLSAYHHYRGLAESNWDTYLVEHVLNGEARIGEVVARSDEADSFCAIDGADNNTSRVLYTNQQWDQIGPANASGLESVPVRAVNDADEPVDTTTVDRSVNRCLHVVRASLNARYIMATGLFPPLSFDDLIDQLSSGVVNHHNDSLGSDAVSYPVDDPAYAADNPHLVAQQWLDTAVDFADMKRDNVSMTLTRRELPDRRLLPPKRVDKVYFDVDEASVELLDQLLADLVQKGPEEYHSNCGCVFGDDPREGER